MRDFLSANTLNMCVCENFRGARAMQQLRMPKFQAGIVEEVMRNLIGPKRKGHGLKRMLPESPVNNSI